MTGNGQPKWQKFPPETLQRLFDAVEVDDIVDEHVALPEPIDAECPEDSIQACFALSLQFWKDGVARPHLLRLARKLLRGQVLTENDRLQYKHIRARYKHLRFAQKLYSEQHEVEPLFDTMTRTLGHLQDALRSNRRDGVIRHSFKLRVLLTKPVWKMVRRAMKRTVLDNAAGFLAYRRSEMRRLKAAIAPEVFTGHEFHSVRKIVSQQLSFYDALRSIAPADEHAYIMSRYLAAINGLMGARHDEMVADSLAGRRDYQTPNPLAADIRWRLEALVDRYPL